MEEVEDEGAAHELEARFEIRLLKEVNQKGTNAKVINANLRACLTETTKARVETAFEREARAKENMLLEKAWSKAKEAERATAEAASTVKAAQGVQEALNRSEEQNRRQKSQAEKDIRRTEERAAQEIQRGVDEAKRAVVAREMAEGRMRMEKRHNTIVNSTRIICNTMFSKGGAVTKIVSAKINGSMPKVRWGPDHETRNQEHQIGNILIRAGAIRINSTWYRMGEYGWYDTESPADLLRLIGNLERHYTEVSQQHETIGEPNVNTRGRNNSGGPEPMRKQDITNLYEYIVDTHPQIPGIAMRAAYAIRELRDLSGEKIKIIRANWVELNDEEVQAWQGNERIDLVYNPELNKANAKYNKKLKIMKIQEEADQGAECRGPSRRNTTRRRNRQKHLQCIWPEAGKNSEESQSGRRVPRDESQDCNKRKK